MPHSSALQSPPIVKRLPEHCPVAESSDLHEVALRDLFRHELTQLVIHTQLGSGSGEEQVLLRGLSLFVGRGILLF